MRTTSIQRGYPRRSDLCADCGRRLLTEERGMCARCKKHLLEQQSSIDDLLGPIDPPKQEGGAK